MIVWDSPQVFMLVQQSILSSKPFPSSGCPGFEVLLLTPETMTLAGAETPGARDTVTLACRLAAPLVTEQRKEL